jgi:hypothetical protein
MSWHVRHVKPIVLLPLANRKKTALSQVTNHYGKHFVYYNANLWLNSRFLSIRELFWAITISQNKDVAILCLPPATFDSQMPVEYGLRSGMWLSESDIG